MEGAAEEPPNKDGKARRRGRRRERERDRSERKKKAPCSLTSPLARSLARSPAPGLSPASPGFYYPFSKTNVGSPQVTWDHLPYQLARARVCRGARNRKQTSPWKSPFSGLCQLFSGRRAGGGTWEATRS